MSVAGLVCPLCREQASARGCQGCLLPIGDMRPAPGSRRRVGSSLRRILLGLSLYGSLTAWTAWQLPDLLVFEAPAALLALVLHVGKGRPWLALVVFSLLVIVLPPLLGPSLATGWWVDLRS